MKNLKLMDKWAPHTSMQVVSKGEYIDENGTSYMVRRITLKLAI